MLAYEIAGPFNKDRKLMKKRNKNLDKLTEVMSMLINEQPLLPKHENHPLHGEYKGW
jgi:mRNA interferase YafQ